MADDMKAQRDQAYNERNRCVAAIARFAINARCDAWIGRHFSDPRETTDNPWDPEWMNIVFVELPDGLGQCSWHIHDSDIPLYSFLRRSEKYWDGHTSEEKYERINRFAQGRTDG
jgi:hypothetical protein